MNKTANWLIATLYIAITGGCTYYFATFTWLIWSRVSMHEGWLSVFGFVMGLLMAVGTLVCAYALVRSTKELLELRSEEAD